jgi:hypothetical protein
MAGNWYRDEDRGGGNRWRGENRERSNSIFEDNDRDRSWSGGPAHGGSQGDDRGFVQRAGDEVRSWFGDDDAERRRDRELRQDDRGWGGLMGPSGRESGSGQGGHDHGDGSGGYDRSEPWGGGDWAGSAGRGYGGSGGRSGDRGPSQDWSGGREDSGRGRSHYGREHGFGGFQGDYGGGSGQGGFGGEGDYRGGRQSFSGQGYGGSQGSQSHGGGGSHPDDHYRSWRDRQIAEMDREYEEYCRDRQQSFHSDFDSWRRNRQAQGGSGMGTSASTGSTGLTAPQAAGAGGDEGGVGSTSASLDSALLGSGDERGASAGGGETVAGADGDENETSRSKG